jgi:hypothetical protein
MSPLLRPIGGVRGEAFVSRTPNAVAQMGANQQWHSPC